MKQKKSKETDWTEPAHLDWKDHLQLKQIKRLYDSGDMNGAMEYARFSCDTVIREEIPPDVWVAMGGTLTPTGEERLRKLIASRQGKATQ